MHRILLVLPVMVCNLVQKQHILNYAIIKNRPTLITPKTAIVQKE